MRTLVLGGGLSGLAAARLLRAGGAEVEVWEASRRVGGRATHEPWGDGVLEPGAQVLFRGPGSPLDRLLQELALPVEPVDGTRWIGTAGSARAVPAHTSHWVRSPLLGPGAKLRMAWGLLRSQKAGQPSDLEAAARDRFGEGFTRVLLPALAAGLFAAPPDRLDAGLLGVLTGRAEGRLVRPKAGMGAFSEALARELEVRLGLPALELHATGDGGFVVRGPGVERRVRRVILALPAPEAAPLVGGVSEAAAALLRAIPFLPLRCWHSRHAPSRALAGGWGLLAHPAREGGMLGFTLGKAPEGRIQLRTSLGGAYPVAPALRAWPGVAARLRRWFPDLGEALETRETRASMPLAEPGHGVRARAIQEALPPGLTWVGAGRYGGGIPGLLAGLEAGFESGG